MNSHEDNAEMVERINDPRSTLKRGALRFWGDWFGRPFDNVHEIVRASAERDRLTLTFSGAEVLVVYDPEFLDMGADRFTIANASRIEFHWPVGPVGTKLQRREYRRTGNTISRWDELDDGASAKSFYAAGFAVQIV